MPATEPRASTKRAMRDSKSTWASFHRPRSLAVIRPLASTAVASATTRPAPPTALEPRCTRCQSLANPSSQLYSHIGETPTRLGRVTERSVSGSKRWGTTPELIACSYSGYPVARGAPGEHRVHVVQGAKPHRLARLDRGAPHVREEEGVGQAAVARVH